MLGLPPLRECAQGRKNEAGAVPTRRRWDKMAPPGPLPRRRAVRCFPLPPGGGQSKEPEMANGLFRGADSRSSDFPPAIPV